MIGDPVPRTREPNAARALAAEPQISHDATSTRRLPRVGCTVARFKTQGAVVLEG